MADLELSLKVNFDNDFYGMLQELGTLQTYKLFEDDDMLLVEKDDVVQLFNRHMIVAENDRRDDDAEVH